MLQQLISVILFHPDMAHAALSSDLETGAACEPEPEVWDRAVAALELTDSQVRAGRGRRRRGRAGRFGSAPRGCPDVPQPRRRARRRPASP
jgi:hypothetical protein